MKIQATNSITFGVTIGKPKKIFYAPNRWNETKEGMFKDYTYKVYDNYVDGKHESTLICAFKGKEWIKSKLKCFLNGDVKTLWSFAEDKKGKKWTKRT